MFFFAWRLAVFGLPVFSSSAVRMRRRVKERRHGRKLASRMMCFADGVCAFSCSEPQADDIMPEHAFNTLLYSK